MNKKQIIIIGGGASGLTAAISASQTAQKNGLPADIVIMETEDRVGKKLLATGNGRCNLSNELLDGGCYLGDPNLTRRVLAAFDRRDAIRFFNSLGLYTKPDAAGRVYPMSRQATSVLDALRAACARYGVVSRTGTTVSGLHKTGNGFVLNGTFRADAVVLACGSPAGRGKVGDTLSALLPPDVRVAPFYPALCALRVPGFTKSLKGVRADGLASLITEDGVKLASDCGEIQYTENGLSGIPVMQLSLFAARPLAEGKKLFVQIDSVPSFPRETICGLFESKKTEKTDMPLNLLLGGLLPKKLGEFLLREAGLRQDMSVSRLDARAADRLLDEIKRKRYGPVRSVGFDAAQAAVGGVVADELDPSTMELKKLPGVFVCGEAVDVTGMCGGYNLQWAWSSGVIAGRCAADGCMK